VSDRAELDDAIKEMLETEGAFLLHVAVMEEENIMPMTPPGASVNEMVFE
jgi:acetolactate synthase-1/2/3 large subunit